MNPQQNTKLEVLTEAIESMCIAVCTGVIAAHLQRGAELPQAPILAENIVESRNGIRSALKEFLKPALQVVSDSKGAERAQFPGGIDDLPCSQVPYAKKLGTIPAPDARPVYPTD